ncbi:hypothetical protein ZWY2020_025115 [Hordeum vulgare]|nr:hypothetical protein ZWY2020_025115 [Hordeum vulgare]
MANREERDWHEEGSERGEDPVRGVTRPAGQLPLATPLSRLAPAIAKTPDTEGKAKLRRPHGDGSTVIIDMEAMRRAIKGFLVVGCLLSPFHANPRIIVDELRASSVWRLNGTVTVQEVASGDGRFVLNFISKEDRRFVLKAQLWPSKHDGVIFANLMARETQQRLTLV